MNWRSIKRKYQLELCYLPWKSLFLTAGICLICGIFVAFSGVNHHTIHLYIPRGSLPLFLVSCLWCVEYFLLGLGLGIFLLSQKCRKEKRFHDHFSLFLCALVFSYAWIPITVRAGNLFFAFLIGIVLFGVLLFLILSIRLYAPIVCILLGACALWTMYTLGYTISLWLFNR